MRRQLWRLAAGLARLHSFKSTHRTSASAQKSLDHIFAPSNKLAPRLADSFALRGLRDEAVRAGPLLTESARSLSSCYGSQIAVACNRLGSTEAQPFSSLASKPCSLNGTALPDMVTVGAVMLATAVPAYVISSDPPIVSAKENLPVELPKDVVLYQYETCPFCNKLKAYMDYYSIPYKVVEVNPFSKKEIKWSEYKKVPILVMGGEQFNDSSGIITGLQTRLNPKAAPAADTEEANWRSWVDDHFVHLLAPNIYRTPTEALESFDYISTHGNFSSYERAMAKYVGAVAMYFISGRLKKKYNIKDERAELFQAADEWVDAVGTRKFLGGEKPNLADLAVYGVLQSIINVRAGQELLEKSKIRPWYERMQEAVGPSCRIPDE